MTIRLFEFESKESYTVDFTANKAVCPICSAGRKKNKEKVLQYYPEKETAYCFHCERGFAKYKNLRQDDKVYKKPEAWKNTTELNSNIVKFFEGRLISQKTIQKLRITSATEWMPQFNKEVAVMCFNFFVNDELINIKYRAHNKKFKLFKDAELVMYNIDSIRGKNECVIVEGEMDVCAFVEAGYNEVVSVPAGASSNTEYLDNYLDYFENKEKIYLATDNDIKGIELRDNLARRLGKQKCHKVSFKGLKDANEYLCAHGRESLLNCLSDAKEYNIEGLFNIKDFESEFYDLYNNGLKPGLQIGGKHDEFISFERGRLYTITGIPNHGKTNWLDFVVAKLATIHKLKFAYFSPENHPLQLHAATLTTKLIGSKFEKRATNSDKIDIAFDFLKQNFWFIKPEKDFTIDNILQIAKDSIKKYGVDSIIIDPYNKIEHQYDKNTTETNYISRLLDKLTTFAIENNIIFFLVAHPKKMTKINGKHDIPSLYDINGSANFYNKTDFGITVYRDFETGHSEIYIQKAKFKHLGNIGMVDCAYNQNNGRYSDFNEMGETRYDNDNWLKSDEQPTEIDFSEVPDIADDDFFNSNFEEAKF